MQVVVSTLNELFSFYPVVEQVGVLSKALLDLYRCPPDLLRFSLSGELSQDEGFFRFGPDLLGFGRTTSGQRKSRPDLPLDDILPATKVSATEAFVPFDPDEVIQNFRFERYARFENLSSGAERILKRLYYVLRPYLGLKARRAVQRFKARNWPALPFPHWPVDTSVKSLSDDLMLLSMRAQGIDRVPFIWFWPKGAEACVTMTHDVETQHGVDQSESLMDLNDEFGIKASFQIVPERRYPVAADYLESLRSRGFEICVQDLNHDGLLYENKSQFLDRVERINQYGREWGARGFRAAILYRRPEWFDALDFSFDMSIPNVGHLDPQRGGCCAVMPYFIGDILELPVTTVQDYTLYHILGEQTIDLWKRQTEIISSKNGLISFIVHPDYLSEPRLGEMYRELLQYLTAMRQEHNLWIATPSQIDDWWRARSQMKIIPEGDSARIEGFGSEDAVLAFALNMGDHLSYEFCPHAPVRKTSAQSYRSNLSLPKH